ncbi:MAG TPA: tetratricopeptide repeat protein [Kofleriaceae bacterium]|nr:tetratricopeptide repeat protein [Kofleriaceae bacterium]
MSHSDFVSRGQALVSSGQYQEAVKVCRLGLLGRPTTVEGRVVLGQALLALKRYDEVLAEMRVALELDHASIAAQLLKGEALLRKGDGQGAVEVLGKLRADGVADSHAAQLLAEAERVAGRSPPGAASQLSVGFLAQAPDLAADLASDQGTKNYPAHQSQVVDPDLDGDEETGGEYTRPTTLATPLIPGVPAPRKRTPAPAMLPPDATPPPSVLAVGDRSGTVEVDPELEGFEVRGDDDFGDVVGPPVARGGPPPDPMQDGRGSVKGSTEPFTRASRSQDAARARASKPRRAGPFKDEVSTVELDDEAMLEVAETLSPVSRGATATSRKPGGTAVRNAVKLPSGPLDLPSPASTRPTSLPQPAQAPPQLAQMIAGQPHVMHVMPPAPQPQPAAVNPRAQIIAALPTAAAVPLPAPIMTQPVPMQLSRMPQPGHAAPFPAMQLPAHMASNAAAARPTIAIGADPQAVAAPAAIEAMFHVQGGQAPAWARQAVVPGGPVPYPAARAGADEPTRRPHEIDPRIAVMLGSGGGVPAAFASEASTGSRAVRRRRSRLQILVWMLISVAVISGGVFAGFQIRSIRLRKQIAAARDRAVDLAKADTWQGWQGARDSLFSIAQASPTIDNKAALARARAVLAYEFGDGLRDAKALVEALAGPSNVDLELASAYLALATSDLKAARELAERARQDAPGDPAAHYVAGQAALLSGDVKGAIEELRRAFEREARPVYAVALAHALGASSAWDEALALVDRAPDNPAALIEKGFLLTGAGRATGGPASELRAQLGKLISEGGKPPADQPRGVSPLQLGLAELALAQVDFARKDLGAAHNDYRASLDLLINDQRFAEQVIETVYAIGELETARKAALLALEKWPASRRARTALAQLWLASGNPGAALDVFSRTADAAGWPKGLTVRGQARLATGDAEGARADFDAALRKLPGFEPALIARTWLDLAAGDLDDARQRIEPRFNARGASVGVVAVYAAVLRASGDPAARDKAKGLLERALAGGTTPDTARAQLELARIDRDVGDAQGARAAYAEASRGGSYEARLEGALLQIEDGDPTGGRETLEQLLKEAGDHPSAALLLETARARALLGAHAGAAELLVRADQAPGVVRWQLDRERARLALRKGDTSGAAQALVRALDGCGADFDTFVLAADTVSTDDKQAQLAQKLSSLVPVRLKGRPDADVIAGKLALAAGNRQDEAEKAYRAARDALVRDKALPRRRAQAAYGIAAVEYFKRDDPSAKVMLDLVLIEDPSIYSAYLFAAEIARPKNPREALKLSQQAAAFNPDSLDAWKMIGALASQLGDRQLVTDAITRVNELAPGSETLRQLQSLPR